MSKAQYDIYRRKVLDLARTLVVKSSASADAINLDLRNLGHQVNENDPGSWKYYLHLAGEYHYTDEPMTVRSLDTLEDIPFTKESLEHHLATSREYRQFGTYFRELVARYPHQEDLIKGVLNPVDIQTAIAAEDGQILYYDKSLVESNEENLIPRLEWWCKVYSRRWLVRAYALVDPLYVPSHLASMYMLIPSVVMNIRLANCHTNYAHSYHIREYLASHQKLDWAVDFMTKKQMLWLYREIRYIERNAGKQTTFRTLIDNVMTERNLPLAEWNMHHSLEKMPEELTPRVEFTRSTLNLDLSAAGIETRNVVEMLDAEIGVARGNARVIDDEAPLIREEMEVSVKDKLETKVLESAVIDTTDAAIHTLADTLLNHWLYLTHLDRYTAILTVDNPRTGAPLILSVKEAFIVFLYAMGKAMGLEITNLPVLPANFVRRLPTPTRAELEGLVSDHLVDKKVFDAIFKDLPPVRSYISTEAFYREIEAVHKNLLWHRLIWATREHADERGMVEGAARHLYHNYMCDLGSSQSYQNWFTERGLDMMQFTRLESQLLAETLVSHATGANLNVTTSLRDIQSAMLRLMSTLSSYSVQYLQSINDQPLLVTDWPMPRIGNMPGWGGDHVEGVGINLGIVRMREEGSVYDLLPGEGWENEPKLSVEGQAVDRVEHDLNVNTKSVITYHYRVEMPRMVPVDYYEGSELTDIVIPETDSYLPIGAAPLHMVFDDLNSPHYALDQAARDTLEERWNARVRDPLDLYGNGLHYPPYLPALINVPLFVRPEPPLVDDDVVLDELEYPHILRDVTLDALRYSGGQDRYTVEALHYPNFSLELVLDELAYPSIQSNVVLSALGYATVTGDFYADALQPPGSVIQVTLDELTYAPATGQYRLDQLVYPEQTQEIVLDELVYPSISLALTVDRLVYPTYAGTMVVDRLTYPLSAVLEGVDYPAIERTVVLEELNYAPTKELLSDYVMVRDLDGLVYTPPR